MFCTITSLVVLSTETSIDFCNQLMTSTSSSGDFLPQLELICHHFHKLGNTSFSNLITLDQLDHYFACCWHCSFFHGSWGPIPGCFSSFTSIWHVFHQTYYSLLVCFIVASGESSAHSLADSFSACLAPRRRLRLGLCFVLQAHAAEYFSCIAVTPRFRVSLHATLLSLVVRWLRRQPSRSPASPVLDACFLCFAPILGFGSSILPRSFASSQLTAIFWSSSSTSRHFRAASCATSRLVCSSTSILWFF